MFSLTYAEWRDDAIADPDAYGLRPDEVQYYIDQRAMERAMKPVYAIEGLDRLGKSTLIEGIQQKLGFFQVIHFSKPKTLEFYASGSPDDSLSTEGLTADNYQQFIYQQESFRNSMIMSKSGARLIFDRWHLGEAVYAPLYRGYSGDYVFDLEMKAELHLRNDVRLILLVEDLDRSKHFVSDGDSFDDTKRREEQAKFLLAFSKSAVRDKRVISVTAFDGSFRPKEEILAEALSVSTVV